MVSRLLEYKARVDKSVEFAFVDEPDSTSGPSTSALPTARTNVAFRHALTDAFSTAFKARRNKPAELIAKFLDKTMRKGDGGKVEQFHKLTEDVLDIYRFTEDKDVFRAFYLRALAKRLLLDRSASNDEENRLLGLLIASKFPAHF